jgi:hypothetical protein
MLTYLFCPLSKPVSPIGSAKIVTNFGFSGKDFTTLRRSEGEMGKLYDDTKRKTISTEKLCDAFL